MASKDIRRVDILKANVFHSNPQENTNYDWKHLEIDVRIEKMKDFFDRKFTEKTLPLPTRSLIFNLLLDNKLKLKKEVKYDRINQRIIDLHVLVRKSNSLLFIYLPDTANKKEKVRKAAHKLFFKRK